VRFMTWQGTHCLEWAELARNEERRGQGEMMHLSRHGIVGVHKRAQPAIPDFLILDLAFGPLNQLVRNRKPLTVFPGQLRVPAGALQLGENAADIAPFTGVQSQR
jgi:hypothetical protein